MINQLPDELAGDVMPDGGLPETFGYKLKRSCSARRSSTTR